MADTGLAQVKHITALSVLALIAEGKTKKLACEIVGTSVATFDRYIADNKDLIPEFVVSKRQALQAQFSDIIDTRTLVVKTLLQKVTEKVDTLSISDLFDIQKEIKQIQDDLQLQLGITEGSATKESDLIKSIVGLPIIQMRPGLARVTQRETTYEFDEGPEVVEGLVITPHP